MGSAGLRIGRSAARWGFAAAALCLCLTAAVAWAQSTPTVQPVVLPRDQAAHPGFGVEWWYTAGTLQAAHGQRYFWFATVWADPAAQLARVNVVDLKRDRIVLARESISNTPPASGQNAHGSSVMRLSWHPRGRYGRFTVAAKAGTGALELSLRPQTPYMLHGDHGVIEQGPGGPSAYYSAPRLAASGELELHGKRIAVSGQGWFDHQWGNFSADPGALRWNWFACQLGDGRNLMLYQFLDDRDRPSGRVAGTLMTAGGVVRHLHAFSATPLQPTVKPKGATTTYPLAWRLRVPAARLTLTLRSLARNQFIVNTFVPSFWEGAAAVTHGPAGRCIVESSRQP